MTEPCYYKEDYDKVVAECDRYRTLNAEMLKELKTATTWLYGLTNEGQSKCRERINKLIARIEGEDPLLYLCKSCGRHHWDGPPDCRVDGPTIR